MSAARPSAASSSSGASPTVLVTPETNFWHEGGGDWPLASSGLLAASTNGPPLVTYPALPALAPLDEETMDFRDKRRKLALDFETVTDVLSKIDFQRIAATDSGRLDFRVMTDAELEEAIGETGSCVKVVRLSEGIRLVDCSTGQQAVIR